MTVYIGLTDPKSPDNVGAVLRAAANYQADHVYFTGIRYQNALKRAGRSVDMSRKIGKKIPISKTDTMLSTITDSMKIVCVELVENAKPLPNFQHPEHVLYLFGPEDGSLDQETIDHADDVIYIPTIGCMNLSASVNVLLYDRMAKSISLSEHDSNTLIKTSRDTNNRLKVKLADT
mgnify:CR=1 FL=1